MFESYLIYILFFTVALIGVSVPFVAISTLKYVRKLVNTSDIKFESIDMKFNTILEQLGELKDAIVLPVKKLDEIEKRSRRLTERLEQLELREQSQRQYDQAIKLIQRGSTVDEVMAVCGLNRGEAELICVMHETDQDGNSAN